MNAREYWIELLKVLLSPQVVIVLGGLWFCQTFKDNLQTLMRRLSKVDTPWGAAGFKDQPTPSAEEVEKLQFDASEESEKNVTAETSNAKLIETIGELKTQLKDSETVSRYWQFRHLDNFLTLRTKQFLESVGEKLYIPMTIVSTQKQGGASSDRLETMLEALTKVGLVEVKSDSDPHSNEADLICITQKGKLFLEWYQTHKLPYTDL